MGLEVSPQPLPHPSTESQHYPKRRMFEVSWPQLGALRRKPGWHGGFGGCVEAIALWAGCQGLAPILPLPGLVTYPSSLGPSYPRS